MLILLISPPGLFRDGVGRLLGDLASCVEVRCIDYAPTALERVFIPDLLVLDGDYVRESLDAVNAVRCLQPDVPIVVLLTTIDSRTVERFVAAGANGYVGKSESADMLLVALRQLLAGRADAQSALRTFTTEAVSLLAQERLLPDATPQANRCALTARQLEVLALAARGESNKSIAQRLDIAEGTVKVHLYKVFKELKVSSRSQASVAAARLQEVSDLQIHQALDGHLSVRRLFANMTPVPIKAGEVLFHKNARSEALYYVVRGTVSLQEIGIEVGPGTMLGEIGIFSPDHRRTCTARCKSDCVLLSASATDAMRLYYQDPEFATYLIQLVTRRLGANKSRPND